MKRKTIRKHTDFLSPKTSPCITIDDIVSVRIKPAKIPDDARYGVVASKKFFRFAVQRNRVKRLLRDWIFYNEDLMLPQYDYIFIAGNNILNTKRSEGRESVKKCLSLLAKNHDKQ